jgi:hypothetical protein
MRKDYPAWICAPCGLKYGNKPVGTACWHIDVCGVCGNTAPVTEPRDYGHLKAGWEKAK